MSIRPFLQGKRPYIAAAFGLFGSLDTRSKSSFLLRKPPPTAPREAPTPLIFLSAKAWDKSSAEGMTGHAAMFAEKGFTCLEVDLATPDTIPATSEALLEHFEKELSSHIRLTSIPFAPVLVARSSGSLIAQTYISSHPASGLILISPNPKTSSPESIAILPTPLKEFNFEAKFPLVIIDTPAGTKVQQKENRLVKEDGIEIITVDDVDGQEAFRQIEMWLDESGF